MATAASDGASLYYETAGEGPPLVLVHGAGGNTLSWWQQVPRLSRRYRVIAVDQRGFGRSRCAPDARHPRFFPADLAAVLDAAQAPRAALICQSLGGWTGLPFALAHPERTAALVLCGTPGGLLTPAIQHDLARVPGRAAGRSVGGMALGATFARREPEKAFLYEQIAALNPPDTVAVYARGLLESRVAPERLEGFATPTLVVVGKEDAFFSVDGLGEVARAIPGARLQVFPESGHSPYFEAPDAFNDLLESFLAEVAPWG
jgi:pimeloyl-ACP methyl ester carboxylesterase